MRPLAPGRDAGREATDEDAEREDAAETTAAEDSKSNRAIRWWAANICRWSSSMRSSSALLRSAIEEVDAAPPPDA